MKKEREREREDGEELMSHAKRNAMQREVVPRVLHRHAPHGGGRHRWRFAYSGIVQELIYLDPVDYYYLYTPYILTALLATKFCWCLAYMDRHPVALGDGVETTLGIPELGYCRCISFHLSISCSEYNNRAMKDGIDVSEHIQAEWLLLKRNSFLGNT